jgi:hypothetical protein
MYGLKKCSIVPYGPKQCSIVLISQSIWNKSDKFIARGLVTERSFSLVFCISHTIAILKNKLNNKAKAKPCQRG